MKRILCVLCMVTLMLSAAGPAWADGEGFAPALDTSASITLLVAGHYDNFEAIEAEFALFREYYPNVKLKYEKIDGDDFEKLMRNELIVDVSDIPDEIPPYEKADIAENDSTL